MDVSGKKAVVTGGGRGIGRAISIALAQNGADVAVTDIIEDNAEQVSLEISALGVESMSLHLDVTSQNSVDAMVEATLAQFGHIDILINNAGVIGANGWEQRSSPNEEDWNYIYEINVKGIVKVSESIIPHMMTRKYGKIVNIASIAGRRGGYRNMPYNVSKTGVISITQGQALELAQHNINVNAICPGLLWTPMWNRITDREIFTGVSMSASVSQSTDSLTEKSNRELFDEKVAMLIPLGREQTPEDIGYLSCFLSSDYSRNITGQAINVSGGYSPGI